MPARLALSTTVCSLPGPPQVLLDRWRSLRATHPLALALDPRLPPPVMRELLARSRAQGIGCVELAHPLGSAEGYPMASPLGAERSERRAATQQLLDTLRLAAEHEVPRLVLHPWNLTLRRDPDALRQRFAAGRALPLAELNEQRTDAAPRALDGLLGCLDPLLERAAHEGITIALLTPAIWPQQLPTEAELLALRAELAGAPLEALPASDWEHAAQVVASAASRPAPRRRGPVAAQPGDAWARAAAQAVVPAGPGSTLFVPSGGAATPPPPDAGTEAAATSPSAPARSVDRALRLADAAGLRLRLPLGCGEIGWQTALPSALAKCAEAILVFDAATTAAEITRSMAWIDAASDPSPAAVP
ncbi:MAG: hypothetical protein IPL40_11770 [Proteobacteria bacterium]|nr:hypothetical protein [Pseudomonadota bacterium]